MTHSSKPVKDTDKITTMTVKNRPSKDFKRSKWRGEINFSSALPISARVDDIAEAIKVNQVVVIAGETGSGKTTQLPKICLSLGYGEYGQIAHTQPRRIAARTVATRIAEELRTVVGDGVGYQVRFTDKSSENTRIKLMTDGVLLAEFQHDRLLRKYDVIIIDEAHERSLNIDFLLGLLKPLCERRPELKVIITSATIDLEKFSRHFTLRAKPAPIIEVSGRTYPVETLYQEPADSTALPDVITKTVKDLIRDEAKGKYSASGDVLVFCAGEREIRDTAQALRKAQLQVNVLPLYSRLSVAEQNKVFKPAQQRKIVLATNVAETSITVPGIAYVIDPGLARISRYSFRSKIQRLPIEAISQASANQRKGRSGRVANGICIRLYSEEDFRARAEFTPAEILRSNLASVILKMLRLGIRDIEHFELIDQPDKRLLNDGFKLLNELGAIDKNHKLTNVGHQMSDLSVDPKFARVLIAANEVGCLRDSLVLISALSIQDPRERPAEKQQAADQSHQHLHHQQSDFYSFLNLWQAINNARDELSNTKFKQYCLDNYWSIARVFEWRELFRQLLVQTKSLGWKLDDWKSIELPKQRQKKAKPTAGFSKRYENLHRALLAGLLSNIATKEVDEQYIATRSRHIHLFPGSAQAKRKPKWLVAGEYLETSRVFAHTIGEIKPEWAIHLAAHLVRHTYSSPSYHKRSGGVRALRKTLLYGLTLRDKENINYAPINPSESREVFIQQALVGHAYEPRGKVGEFVAHNRKLIADIEKLETKTRRRNLLVDDSAIYEFYENKLPLHINSRQALEKWLSMGNEEQLKLDRSALLQTEISNHHGEQFPDKLVVLGKDIRIVYKFDPNKRSDGVTMLVPISVLAPFPEYIGSWLVPGLLKEKSVALIKTLKKPIRRNFAPAKDTIDRVFEKLLNHSASPSLSLEDCLAEELFKTRGVRVTGSDFDPSKLDDFYRMNYRVIDTDGSLVEEGRDLVELKARYANEVKESVRAEHSPARRSLEKHHIEKWAFRQLPHLVDYLHEGMTIQAYSMLKIREDGSISLLLSDNQEEAKYLSHHAVIELAKLGLNNGGQKQSLKYLRKEIMARKRTDMENTKHSSLAAQLKSHQPTLKDGSEWIEKIINAGAANACFGGQPLSVSGAAEFESMLKRGRQRWVKDSVELEQLLVAALQHRDQLFSQIDSLTTTSIAMDLSIEDIKAQIYRLFEPSFLSYTSSDGLKQYPRFLRAIEARIERLQSGKILNQEQALLEIQNNFDAKLAELEDSQYQVDFVYLNWPEMNQFRLMIEEWRVSLFAQHLSTRFPISAKRLLKFWHEDVVKL